MFLPCGTPAQHRSQSARGWRNYFRVADNPRGKKRRDALVPHFRLAVLRPVGFALELKASDLRQKNDRKTEADGRLTSLRTAPPDCPRGKKAMWSHNLARNHLARLQSISRCLGALQKSHVLALSTSPSAQSGLDQDWRIRSKAPHKCQKLNFWTRLPKPS